MSESDGLSDLRAICVKERDYELAHVGTGGFGGHRQFRQAESRDAGAGSGLTMDLE